MNKNLLVGLAVVGVVLVGVAGFYVGKDSVTQQYGNVINMSNALNQQRLFNDFASVVSDLQGLRAAQSSTVYSQLYTLTALGANNTSTSTASVTVNATNTAGDFLAVSFATTSVPYVRVSVQPVSATTVLVTFTNTSSTQVAALGGSSTIYVWKAGNATFLQPGALNTTTSSVATST